VSPLPVFRRLVSVAGLLLAMPAALVGQAALSPTGVPSGKRQLVGVVRDPAGAALQGVTVSIAGNSVRTDVRGAFQLFTTDIDTLSISLRMLGYEPIDAFLTARNKMWDTVLVQMDPAAQNLAKVKVADNVTRSSLGVRDFDERKARGIGQFVTREEIVARGSSRLSDVLRTKRGVNVIKGNKVRFVAHRAQCMPYIWLDGVLSRGMEVDEIPSSTVEAMELYSSMSTVPIEFQSIGANTNPCGTIVIWTRIPNGKSP
jgi:hypothetical protein